jgi:hypothetical protein
MSRYGVAGQDQMPDMKGATLPILPRLDVTRVAGHFSSFDAGRGCPFQRQGLRAHQDIDACPLSRDHHRRTMAARARRTMDELNTELVLLIMVSALLCGVALIYGQPLATGVFAALTCGALVSAATL